jgi:Co/Zn/Cd efflux system component
LSGRVLWAWSLLRESLRVLLEMAPKGRNVHETTSGLREHFPPILDTNHEHVWTITPDVVVFSAYLTRDPEQVEPREVDGWLRSVEAWLAERFDVRESTLQVTWGGTADVGRTV